MSWQDTVDMTVWDSEPDPGPESAYTRTAGPDWHAWNEWAPEQEVADFCGRLVELLEPQVIVETGVSQGFITRRIIAANQSGEYYLYEADPHIRRQIPYVVEPDPTPDQLMIQSADLMVLDSHWPERLQELQSWTLHGKPGSYVFMHDVQPAAAVGTGHRMLAELVSKLGLPTMWFDNPRGSVLLYRPEGWQAPNMVWPRIGPRDLGSVLVVQIDPGEVSGGYSHCMAQMLLHSGSVKHGGVIHDDIRKLGGPRIYHHRDGAVRYFLETDATWLLQIDSDMVFPRNLVDELLSVADPDTRPIVAGHCYMWRGESGPLPVMWRQHPGGKDTDMILYEDYPRDGLVQVAATGGACILIHRRVFETIQAADPDYTFPWYEETMNGRDPVGEDVTFCVRARRAGFPVYVHTGLDIGHEKLMTMNHSFFSDYRRGRRFVVTGWPRSATGYTAQLLQKAGVACTHEGVYTPTGVDWQDHWGDSSWMAAPHLASFDGPIVHVVRDPLDVYSSLIGIELFNPDSPNVEAMRPYVDFARRHVAPFQYRTFIERQNLGEETWQKYTALFMLKWHRLITSRHPDLTIRVEDLDVDQYQQLVYLARPPRPTRPSILQQYINQVPTDWNRPIEARPPRLTWDDVVELAGDTLANWLHDLADDLDYQ